MPFTDVTNVILNEETQEIEKSRAANPSVKAAVDRFDAECERRRELAERG